MRSAFGIYRHPRQPDLQRRQANPIDVPLLLVGEHVFGPVLPLLAGNLRASYRWSDIEARIVADGKHYLAEELPDDIAELIERHAANR